MCLHDVYGDLGGSGAVLECRRCKQTREVREGQFDEMNAFLGRHRECMPIGSSR